MVSESETEPELAAFSENVPVQGPPSPPNFSPQLRPLKVDEGADATFQCSLTGNPRPKVRLCQSTLILHGERFD